MARFARVVVPGVAYHITHRGNRREAVFFDDEDRHVYLALLREYTERYGLAVWAYCLMTNHIHLIAVPQSEGSMALAMGRAHMRYARWLNRKRGWCGHLWANRYFSSALDDEHLWRAVRYVEANPLRARMVTQAQDYPWSSCAVHAALAADDARVLAPGRPFPGQAAGEQWLEWVNSAMPQQEIDALRLNTSTGRPSGSKAFIKDLEVRLDRLLNRRKPGRKRKSLDNGTPDMFGGSL